MNTNKLLLDESPILVQPKLAVALGLNEAIFLQQLHYKLGYVEKSKGTFGRMVGGRPWLYYSYPTWQEEDFPFWSVATIKRTVKKLGVTGHNVVQTSSTMNKFKTDRTLWYTINYEELKELTEADTNSPSCQVDTMQNPPVVPIVSTCDDATYQVDTITSYQPDTITSYQVDTLITEEVQSTKNNSKGRAEPAPSPCCCSRPSDSCPKVSECKFLNQKTKIMYDSFAFDLLADNNMEEESMRSIHTMLKTKGVTEDEVVQSLSHALHGEIKKSTFAYATKSLTKKWKKQEGVKTWSDVIRLKVKPWVKPKVKHKTNPLLQKGLDRQREAQLST